MTSKRILEAIDNMKITTAINSMGCSENWYDFFYAMNQTFTKEEIENMTERECTLLEKLAIKIQDGLY